MTLRYLSILVVSASMLISSTSNAMECPNGLFPLRTTNNIESGFASAVLVDINRWLFVTPFHVVREAKSLSIVESIPLIVVAKDEENDIAVLAPIDTGAMQIWAMLKGKNIKAVAMANRSPVSGSVLICSYPFKTLKAEVTLIVDPSTLLPGPLDKHGFLRTERVALPGESGGAVLNPEGQLVGLVVTMLARDRKPVAPGIAIPVEKLLAVVPQ